MRILVYVGDKAVFQNRSWIHMLFTFQSIYNLSAQCIDKIYDESDLNKFKW